MPYVNREFNWDFTKLRRFYDNYIVKWLNSTMSWTAAQMKQARANLGFGNGDIATGADFDNPDATNRAKVLNLGAALDGMNDGVYDVSKRYPTGGPNSDGKFTLEYILANANTLIPTSRRHGGMEICFVHSSDNNYVQYIYIGTSTANADFVNTANWEKIAVNSEIEQLNQKIIYLVDFGQQPSNVTNNGDVYYNTGTKLLRQCNDVEHPDLPASWVTIPARKDAIYIFNGDEYLWNGTDMILYLQVMTIVGMNYAPVGITENGDVYYNTKTKLLYRCVDVEHQSEQNAWVTIKPSINSIYVYNNYLYLWNGSEMVSERQIIKLVGMNTDTSGITNNGDIYYNTNTKQLRQCNNVADSDNPKAWVTIPARGDSLYLYNNKLFIWNGSDLIVYPTEIQIQIAKSDIPFAPFAANTPYVPGDRVSNSEKFYICKYPHTSGARLSLTYFNEVKKEGIVTLAEIDHKTVVSHSLRISVFGPDSLSSGIEKVGDIWYNTSQKQLRRCSVWNGSMQNSSYETVDFASDGAYFYEDKIYIYSTAEKGLVLATKELPDLSGALRKPTKDYFSSDREQLIAKTASQIDYMPTYPKNNFKYRGQLDSKKKFLAVGFDDFWYVDFTMTQPLFEKYRGAATFNKITVAADVPVPSEESVNKVLSSLFGGHEVGDHTFTHDSKLVNYPLWDGSSFPTNSHFRSDRGDGYNVFGLSLDSNVSSAFGVDAKWGELTDAQCQTIRESHAIIKLPDLLAVFDALSNRYLGTSGSSSAVDSWDGEKYTKGIFTGCETSENHEIWERVCTVTQMYYKEHFGLNYDLFTWCYPGGDAILYFEDAETNIMYYDSAMTKIANDLAKFESSLNGRNRSFIDVLREFGYVGTHGSVFPSKWDGQQRVAMYENLFFNQHYSRQDALLYPTDLNIVDDLAAYNTYPASFFEGNKKPGTQMYDRENANGTRDFRTYIEYIRNATARGSIAGGVFDEHDTYSDRMFWEEVLKFCVANRIEMIPKATAYDICFNCEKEGELLGNVELKNSAAEYFTDSDDIPTNPDGYTGDCYVSTDSNNLPTLVANGETRYVVFGIPTGNLLYKATLKGNGSVSIYAIKNNSPVTYQNGIPSYSTSDLTLLATVTNNENDFSNKEQELVISDNPLTAYEQECEGYGNKIMGVLFVYSSGLEIKNLSLKKK